jgi:hypothetical protein
MPLFGPESRLDTGTLPGTFASILPNATLVGTSAYCVWEDTKSGVADAFANVSPDSGGTWAAIDTHLPTNTPGIDQAHRPRVAASGTNVYAAWVDGRNGPNQDVFFRRSIDGGTTWVAPDVRLDSGLAGAANSTSVEIAAVGTNVYVVWQDFRNGQPDVFFNRSTDGGVTWLANDVRLDTDPAGAAPSFSARIAAAGTDVYVVWQDGRGGSLDVRANVSNDGGTTWLAADLRLDTDPLPHPSVEIAVAADGAGAVVTWTDSRLGPNHVFANRTTDHGVTWLATDVRVDVFAGTNSAGSSTVALQGGVAWIAWTDTRAGSPEIRFSKSTDGGATWLAADVRLDTRPAGGASTLPNLCADAGFVFVVWQDTRDGQPDVRFQGSADSGDHWLPNDLKLDGDPNGATASTNPICRCVGQRVHVFWQDSRAGQDDVFTRRSP